jgi:putative FmdB family regulatory protein
MPIYEYRCESCGRVFARLQAMNATDQAQTCPDCNSDDVQRILSTFAAASTSSNSVGCPSPAPCPGAGGG